MLIVKKMPILQGFPDLETVKKLTKNHRFSERFVPLFYHYFMILKPLDWDEIHLFYI